MGTCAGAGGADEACRAKGVDEGRARAQTHVCGVTATHDALHSHAHSF